MAEQSAQLQHRAPAKVVNHLEESLRMLQARGYQQLQLLASYPSYMTGLMFHRYEEKPEDHKIYICVPESNNAYDAQAMGIISSRNKRIAFVPQIFTEHFALTFPGLYAGTCVVVAYCTGFCTPKSAQCLYNVYQIVGAQPHDMTIFQQHVSQTPYSPVPASVHALPPTLVHHQPPHRFTNTTCTVCKGPANRCILPCRHYTCCVPCAAQLYNRACPTCGTVVHGTTAI